MFQCFAQHVTRIPGDSVCISVLSSTCGGLGLVGPPFFFSPDRATLSPTLKLFQTTQGKPYHSQVLELTFGAWKSSTAHAWVSNAAPMWRMAGAD